MGTLKLNQYEPCPDSSEILEQALQLDNYYALYWHHLQGVKLPENFPVDLIERYPDILHAVSLVSIIEKQIRQINSMLDIQNEYLDNYSKLYLSFVYDNEKPEIPAYILIEFPEKKYKKALKQKIDNLNTNINNVKSKLLICT